VPDLDVGALDRAAGGRVHDGEAEHQRHAADLLGDVAARERFVDPVRALGHLGREHAARRHPGGRRDRRARRRDRARAEDERAEAGSAAGDDLAAPESLGGVGWVESLMAPIVGAPPERRLGAA